MYTKSLLSDKLDILSKCAEAGETGKRLVLTNKEVFGLLDEGFQLELIRPILKEPIRGLYSISWEHAHKYTAYQFLKKAAEVRPELLYKGEKN